jgi:hypothetical protein
VTNWIGEQYNQVGNHNIGKIDQRSGNAVNPVTPMERMQAVGELVDFVDHLHRLGLVSESGDPVDENAIKAEVSKKESTLRKVANALGRGAAEAMSKAVDHVVVPLVLKLIEAQSR